MSSRAVTHFSRPLWIIGHFPNQNFHFESECVNLSVGHPHCYMRILEMLFYCLSPPAAEGVRATVRCWPRVLRGGSDGIGLGKSHTKEEPSWRDDIT